MRRHWVAACALALAGAAFAVGGPAAFAEPLPHVPRGSQLAPPTPRTRATAPPQATPAAAPTPPPTPPPPPQVVNVTPTQAAPGDAVTVSGSGFPPGNRVQVYLDGANHPLGPSVVVGGDGTFTTQETVPAGATADLHQICAQVNTATPTCAQLQVTAAATPTPAPTPVATPATAAPTAASTAAATPAPASNGLLSSLFPWILIPIAILVLLAVLAIVLLVRSRRARGAGDEGGAAAAPPPVFGDPRGGGQPTVTHYSPRGYRAPGEPAEGTVPRGYRRQGLGAPVRGQPLPGGGDRPGLRDPGYGNPELPGDGRGWLPEDDRPGLPGRGPGSLPPSRRPPGLPPGDEDDDDPFSTPPRR